MKKLLFLTLVSFASMGFLASCSNDDSSEKKETSKYGVPIDDLAGAAPTVTANNVTIPNFSAPSVEEGINGAIGNITFTGIKGIDGEFLSLAGTGESGQNIWMTIDNVAKSLVIVNADDVAASRRAAKKGMADIVFLVDNSGSMDEEADALAEQVLEWAQSLSEVVDCKFGCVGYGDNSYGIDGGMDLADITELNDFLNRSNVWGTYRTYDFYGANAKKLENLALSETQYYNGSYNECGALALHFADEQFSWREGSNRIYINFTDEPNQPNELSKWSVETLNAANTQLYNWNAAKGTVHSVYSEDDQADYEEGGWYYDYNKEYPYLYEKPWAMSDYTGGITLFTDRYFTNFKLDDIEVTGAILSSYILRFNITDDLRSGSHTITITVKDKNGSMATKTFPNVVFSL